MDSHQLINQTSGEVEYYTPSEIVEAARRVMGAIDLDPASCAIANKRVKAHVIYTKEDDGLIKSWAGRVWMNHPFGREEHPCEDGCKKKTCVKRGYCCTRYTPGNKQWVNKLVEEYVVGRMVEACAICFASTSEAWFRPLMNYPQCYLSPRTNYYGPDGQIVQGVSKGSVVTYLGYNVRRFAEGFGALGSVMIPFSR